MLCIQNDNTDPYFNLTLEEYILKEFDEDCFMLWQNEPCVVIGKNQNPLAEINLEFAEKNNIKVARRLSGGGAVYHDLGNLNFTFIINDTQNCLRNYRKFTMPIVDVLTNLGVKAEWSERNDLIINGLKFSGNAQYKCKNRLLHHGTILFSSSLNNVRAALKADNSINGRWVKSIPSSITNVQEYLKAPLSIGELKTIIQKHIKNTQENFTIYNLTSTDIEETKKLAKEKYANNKWINLNFTPVLSS